MLIFASLPSFVVGIVLILVFSVWLGILPAVSFSPTPAALVLPVATLVLGWTPLTARMIRAGIIAVLDSDFVQMARLKGLPERLVLRRHILPNALVPGIQAFALTAASMPAGIVIVEYLFAYPGLGNTLIQAVQLRDTTIVEAIIVILVAVYVVANLLSDVATVLLTPRLKTEAVGMSVATSFRRNLKPDGMGRPVLVALVVCVAILGPLVAPYEPDAIFGRSFAAASRPNTRLASTSSAATC